MGIRLDHIIVPSHNRLAAAKSLAGLLDIPWRESAPGPADSLVHVRFCRSRTI
jgi:hypothetical protein